MNEIASKQSSVLLRLMQRGEEQHIQCGWHLKFCADLTRTAPLGSQSGVVSSVDTFHPRWNDYIMQGDCLFRVINEVCKK